MGLLTKGRQFITRSIKGEGQTVIYQRRGAAPLSLTMTGSHQTYEVTDEEGITSTSMVRDYLFAMADMTVGEPRPGDVIRETISGEDQTFEVLPLGDRPCWEWADSERMMAKVHTKRVG